jgi:hypothetical protein
MRTERTILTLIPLSLCLLAVYVAAQFVDGPLNIAEIWSFPLLAGACVFLTLLIILGNAWGKKLRLVHWGFFSGILFWFMGELTNAIGGYVATSVVGGVDVSDVFFLVGYVIVIVVLALFLWDFRGAFTLKGYLTTALLTLFLLDVFYALVIIKADNPILLTDAPNLIYPALDAVLVYFGIVMVVVLRGDPLSRAWLFVAVGVLLTGIGDALYVWGTTGGWYYDGHRMELLWLWGYLCIGVGIYRQRTVTNLAYP